jgi:hypothetical protein
MSKTDGPVSENTEDTITIDFADLYKFNKDDLAINISTVGYSNIAYMQVGHRDVYIDFLGMPGTKRDGKMVIDGIRIFMSHTAAKALADSLNQLLDDVYRRGKMESYPPKGIKKTTTTVDQTSKETQA